MPCATYGSREQAGASGIDVGDVERAGEQLRVAREVRLEQVDAAAMQRHHRRVGRLEAVLDVHLQDAVLGRRVPAVRAEQVLHRVRSTPVGPTTRAPSASRTAVPSTLSVYAGPASTLVERRSAREIVEHAHRAGLALERGPPGRRLEIACAELVQQTDDAVAAEVRRVRHRRTPVAVAADQDVLVDERRVARDERAHRRRASSRQIASASCTAWTSRVQLGAR